MERLRGDSDLCDILEYDPETEHGPNAQIHPFDPPWETDFDAHVVVRPEPDGTTRNNSSHELTFTCEVTLEVGKAWYTEDFDIDDGGRRFEILDLIDETMVNPGISGLRHIQGIEFNRSEPNPNYARAWTAVYNYERSRIYHTG